MVGVPLFADECTTRQMCLSFARLLIEVDVTKHVPKVVCIEDVHGNIIQQKVHYDGNPPFCHKCQTACHDCGKKRPTTAGF